MKDSVLSGDEILKAVRNMEGTWGRRLQEATDKFGERGRMFVRLNRAMVIGRSSYETAFQDLGFNIDRILKITGQRPTAKGFQKITKQVREWLAQDVCPDFLKGERDSCFNVHCKLKHKIPSEYTDAQK
jgi:hypothetical protein